MTEKLNALAAGYSVALVSAAGMLLLGIVGNLGVYMAGVNAMMQWHVFFSLSMTGILAGMAEAAIFGFIFAYAVVTLYNRFAKWGIEAK
jgi:hypothetical protein